jgi:hypothetical protein
MAIDILTNIENNIKLHFFSYIRQYVNSIFKIQFGEQIENCNYGEKTKLKETLKKDLYQIKEDLVNNTLNSDNKYHSWINENTKKIYPSEFKESYQFDIKNHPQKYIPGMIYMNKQIELIGTKMFQFFPLRNNIIMKYIPLDTKVLIDLFIEGEVIFKNIDGNEYTVKKSDCLMDINGYKDSIWENFFDLKKIKRKNYKFDYRISTDCFGVSLQMINKKFIEREQLKKQNMKLRRNIVKTETENMTQVQKDDYKKSTKENKLEEQINKKIKYKELKNKTQPKTKIHKQSEFLYIDELDDLSKLNKYVCIDPGKKCLLYMKDKYGNRFRYSNKMHIKRTKRLKYQKLLQNYKDKNNISKLESELSIFNSKSCDLKKFKEFIFCKNKINKELLEKYKNDIFRKLKWFGYIERQKTESLLINNIKEKFGEDTALVFGDWSDKLKVSPCRLKYISTPNVSLKRKLNEHFTIYNLDEFRTSCLSK